MGDHRALQGHDPLHRADGDPHVHEVGRRVPGGARPLEPAAARLGRRADQPGGVDLVPASTSAATAARSSTPGGRPRPGAIMISPLPGVTTTQAGLGDVPAAGRSAPRSSTTHGDAVGRRRRLPRARPTVAGDAARDLRRRRALPRDVLVDASRAVYFAGDGAKLDDDGYFWLLGRVDDVMNVSGHRISTTEVESALVDHPAVAEAAVVGRERRDDRPGDRRLRDPEGRHRRPTIEHGEELREHVAEKIGPIARPRTIVFTDELPKTRVGQDHAPAAARRRRGPRRSATRPRSPTRRSSTSCAGGAESAPGRGVSAEPTAGEEWPTFPGSWTWRDGPVRPARR